MAKINLDNISTALSKTDSLFYEMDNISYHDAAVPIEYIYPSEYNPYNEFDQENDGESIKQLSDNIALVGLLEPLLLQKVSNVEYRILSGERRYKALKLLKWKSAPSNIYDNLDSVTAELKLHCANLESREYTSSQKFRFYKDVARLLEKLKDDGKLTGTIQQAAAAMLQISVRQVRKYKRICELPAETQQAVESQEMSINEAYTEAVNNKKIEQESANIPIKNAKAEPSLSDNNFNGSRADSTSAEKTSAEPLNNETLLITKDEQGFFIAQVNMTISQLEKLKSNSSSLTMAQYKKLMRLLSRLLEVE